VASAGISLSTHDCSVIGRPRVPLDILGILLGHIGQPLKTGEAPRGIVSFELAFTAARSEAIVRSWTRSGRSRKTVCFWTLFSSHFTQPLWRCFVSWPPIFSSDTIGAASAR